MFQTFSKTVTGASHIRKGILCEDNSICYSDRTREIYIAAVSDGHGETACFRSHMGSRLAVETAVDVLKGFANSILLQENEWTTDLPYSKKLTVEKYKKQLMRSLTDRIIYQWNNRVYDDIKNHPFLDSELKLAGDYLEEYQAGRALTHAYGCTLIAALAVSHFLILIQQGDGRCDVFFSNGSICQPVPWDEQCYENITTSMCGEDAATEIRNCVIDISLTPVIACCLVSDGIEDSFEKDEDDPFGTQFFFRKISVEAVRQKRQCFDDFLGNYLSEVSSNGSGDDMSVAVIANRNELAEYVSSFENALNRRGLLFRLKQVTEKLSDMEYKRKQLKGKFIECDSSLKASVAEYDSEKKKATTLKDEYEKMIAVEKKELEQFQSISQASSGVDEYMAGAYELYANAVALAGQTREMLRCIWIENSMTLAKTQIDKCRKEINEIIHRRQQLENQIRSSQKILNDLEESIPDQEENLQNVKEEYEAYELTYKRYEEEKSTIKQRLMKLSETGEIIEAVPWDEENNEIPTIDEAEIQQLTGLDKQDEQKEPDKLKIVPLCRENSEESDNS